MKATIDLDLPTLPCTNFAPASRLGPHVPALWRIFFAKLVHEEGGVRAFYGSDEGFGRAIAANA